MKIRFVAISLLTLALCACSDNKSADTATEPTVEVVNITTPAAAETVVCTTDYTPVCGSDGKTYSNACQAGVAAVTVASQGECAAPATPMAAPADQAAPMAPATPEAAPAPEAAPTTPSA